MCEERGQPITCSLRGRPARRPSRLTSQLVCAVSFAHRPWPGFWARPSDMARPLCSRRPSFPWPRFAAQRALPMHAPGQHAHHEPRRDGGARGRMPSADIHCCAVRAQRLCGNAVGPAQDQGGDAAQTQNGELASLAGACCMPPALSLNGASFHRRAQRRGMLRSVARAPRLWVPLGSYL